MGHTMVYLCTGLCLVYLRSVTATCDYHTCSEKYESDCEQALHNGNEQESLNAKNNYKTCLVNLKADCSTLTSGEQGAIDDLLHSTQSCDELLYGDTAWRSVPTEVKSMAASTDCVVRGLACTRRKREATHDVDTTNDTDSYTDWDGVVDRYSDCLCRATKRYNSCSLELPVFSSDDVIGTYVMHQIVVFWNMEIKKFKCYVISRSKARCYFRRRIEISTTQENDVKGFMAEKENNSSVSDQCGSFCFHYRRLFDAINQQYEPVEDAFIHYISDQCPGSGQEVTTISSHTYTQTPMWTRSPTISVPGNLPTSRSSRPPASYTRPPHRPTSDRTFRPVTTTSPNPQTTTPKTGEPGAVMPGKGTNATIIGIVVGLVLVVALLAIGVWFWKRHRKNRDCDRKPRYEIPAARQNSHTYAEIADPIYVNEPKVSPRPNSSVAYDCSVHIPDILSGTQSRDCPDDTDIYQVLDDYSLAGSTSVKQSPNPGPEPVASVTNMNGRPSDRRSTTLGRSREYLELVPSNSVEQSGYADPTYDIAADIADFRGYDTALDTRSNSLYDSVANGVNYRTTGTVRNNTNYTEPNVDYLNI